MYTWHISYEVYSKFLKEWVPTYLRTTDDAVRKHIRSLTMKELDGLARNVKVTAIDPPAPPTPYDQD
jgi:hypothetical protein